VEVQLLGRDLSRFPQIMAHPTVTLKKSVRGNYTQDKNLDNSKQEQM
jgi:hypothetical protein